MSKKYFFSITHTASACFLSLFKSPRFLVLSAAADFLFLFLYGLVTAPLIQKLIENMIGFAQRLTTTNKTQSPWSFLVLILAYLLVVYVLFVVFQGVAWWSASRLARKKVSLPAYLVRFAKAQVLWYGLFVFVHSISYVSTLAAIATQQAKSLAHAPLFVVLFGILLYLSVVCASLTTFASAGAAIKKTLSVGIGKMHRLLLPVMCIIIVFFVVNLVIGFFFYLLPQTILGRVMFVLLSSVAVFPLLCWARVFLMRTLQKLFKP